MVMLGRIDRYLDRVKKALRNGQHTSLLADVAELSEIGRRLYNRLEKEGRLRTENWPEKHEIEEE